MRRVLKWAAIGLGTLIVLGLLAGGGAMAFGRSKLNRSYPKPTVAALRTDDPALLVRGEHVATIHGCNGCHGQNMGGMLFFDDVPGKVYAPNLTRGRGGVATHYATDADWDRAVRHGIRPSGRGILPFMPWGTFSRMGDADMAALIAYLRQVPAVDNELPATTLRPIGYLIAASAPLGTEPGPPPHNQVTEPEPTAAYGAHLASHTCVECHGENLLGADRKGPPQGPSLQGAARWSLQDFTRAVRQGIVPGGRQLSEEMPYLHFSHLSDVEVEALYQHLQTLPRS